MTIPLSPASERRGPRETLLQLTATYLRRGELDAEERRSAAHLAARARRERAGAGGAPDWSCLAAALAAMLRGETPRALELVSDAERGRCVPPALMGPLLGLGVRAALAADRPALAERWRARAAARGTGAPPTVGDDLDGSVLATLPELVRTLMAVPPGPTPEDERAAGAGYRGAGEEAGDEVAGQGYEGKSADGGEPGSAERSAGRPERLEEGRRAHLHVVMDAYHGDVVSLPARVRVLEDREAGAAAGGDAAGTALPAGEAGEAFAPGAPGGLAAGAWPGEGTPLLRVQVAATEAVPSPPDADGWHVRFVGRLRALDARSSDGSLLELVWDERGFVVTLVPPEWLGELGTPTAVLATRVTHVVVVPES